MRNPNWSIAHGFFGIAGGVSTGMCAGLNGALAGDTKENVEKNRQIALTTLGIFSPGIIGQQNHTSTVRLIPRDMEIIASPADALVTKSSNWALGVVTADCAPVLFYDPHEGIVGAAHAGWRGAANGILENTVQEMYGLGAKACNIQATIGPTIARSSYGVSLDFIKTIQEKTPFAIEPMTCFLADSWFFDLPMYIARRLAPLVSQVYTTGHNTYDSDFFSRRYALHTHKNLKSCLQGEILNDLSTATKVFNCFPLKKSFIKKNCW